MSFLSGSCTVAAVARATPQLNLLLSRALSTSGVLLGGGKRTVQQQPASPSSTRRPGYGLRDAPSISGRKQDWPTASSQRRLRDGNPVQPTTRRRLSPITDLRSSASQSPSSTPPVPTKSFASFPLHPSLLATLERLIPRNAKTTPVQGLSLPHLLSPRIALPPRPGGKSQGTVIAAETGSGKTLAYLLPLLHHLKRTDPGPSRGQEGTLRPRGVVISPTHELTRQSTGVAKAFSHDIKLSVAGASDTAGRMRREGSVDLLFSTGGTLRKMLGLARDGEARRARDEDDIAQEEEEDDPWGSRKAPRKSPVGVDLGAVEWAVIDEADVLLGPDFASETLSILSRLPPTAHLVLVSATLPPSLTSLLSGPLGERYHWTKLLSPGLHRLPSSLSTRMITSSSGNLFADVTKEVRKSLAEDELRGEKGSKMLVFANADRKVTGLVEALNAKGVGAIGWTGEGKDRTPGSQGALAGFLTSHKPSPTSTSRPSEPQTGKGGARVLVTTSLLSRGLDFSNISTVILLDPPRDTLDFVHRAGRAGRAGRKGRVIVFGMGDFKGLAGRGSVGRGIKEVVRKPSKRPLEPTNDQYGARRQPIRSQVAGGRQRV